ncbi:DUF2939 domain-containing protein [Aeromonas caviae]|uniref:DUF2939 domain-containing protein n=1 Tax=Aeromonas caviae TaxID=648 RepID=UPI002B2453AE|nr:DUF2939 domain-containing protein [Aeromonas caviae]MEA9421266.1 DUF2939 domain-containing protein [Aeromonas caviae]
MNKGTLLGLTAVGLCASYVLAEPYLTVYHIKQAAKQHDSKTLSSYIDLPRVRQSLTAQLNASRANKMVAAEGTEHNPFAAMGIALGDALVDQMLAIYVSPEGIGALMTSGPATDTTPLETSISYQSLQMATVDLLYDGKFTGYQLHLSRTGFLGWKVTALVLGLD